MPREGAGLTVGITTRNRAESLARCLASLRIVEALISEVIVVDDSSDVPVRQALEHVPTSIREKFVFVEQPGHRGYIVARNAIIRRARTPFVLLLDDDTALVDRAPLQEALEIMERHREVAAVACAQANEDGSPWPPGAQPAAVDYPCLVAAFTGFAHLVRRDDLLEVGGLRESFEFYGEEKELCLRLLDAERQVLYLPHARVVHVPDPSGRSASRYLRQVIRNDCLGALYNEPLPLPLASVPLRLYRYFVMRRNQQVNDRGGFVWILRELIRLFPDVMRSRRPVRWRTLRRWRGLRAHPPRFESRRQPGEAAADHVGAPAHLANADVK